MTRRRRKARRPREAAPVDVTIERIGALGDGVAGGPGGPLYVAGALPGEVVTVRPGAARGDGHEARLVARAGASPDRVEPPCPHFGTCGGCALQHLAPGPYAAWKRERVVEALARRGFVDVPVEPARIAPPASRRRATLALRGLAGGSVAGFRARRGTHIVDLESCPVLDPALERFARAAGALVEAGETATLEVTAVDSGVDALLELDAAPVPDRLERWAGLARDRNLARLTHRRDPSEAAVPVFVDRTPVVTLSGVAVDVPPGAFLQPTAWGEREIATRVAAATAGTSRVADLFAGLGAIGFALAEADGVDAWEGDELAVAAARKAAGRSGLGGRMRFHQRDLERRPLMPDELAGFEAVIFDPPRTGAPAQSAQLAMAAVPVVVAVSCNPATFARDARALVDGGYRLERVWPIDQFLWSHHVELVARFSRP